jgi:iron complex transport system permease protein
VIRRPILAVLLASGALLGSILFAFSVGKVPVPPGQLVRAIGGSLVSDAPESPMVETVVWRIRGPRILAALLIGAGLSMAGACYQGLFRNPLVSPDLLGVSAGASLGAVLGIFFSLGAAAIQALAFVSGLLAVGLVLLVAGLFRRQDPILVLILSGVVIGTMMGAVVSLLKVLADPYNQLPAMTFWLLGSLARSTTDEVLAAAPAILLGAIPLLLLRFRLNVLSLPEEEALALGVPTRPLRLLAIFCATLMTSASVAVAGVIGWVGLLVPHLARLLTGPDFGRLLPVSALLGGAYLLLVDTAARSATLEIPLGILTAILGTPVFLWALAISSKSWE